MNYCNYCNDGKPFSLIRPSTRRLLKQLLFMKFLILFSAFWLQVSAAVHGQQITMTYKDAALKDVLTAVRKQTGYYFFYETKYLDNAKPVTVTLKNVPIATALQSIFQNQPFEFNIDGKMITVQPKQRNILQKVTDLFSVLDIRGKVVDEEGKPLPGASVKAGGKVAITDANGNFQLLSIEDKATVEVSYIGYKTVLVLASADFMTIVLMMNSADLQEVVVNKGYYTTKQELNTGSVGVLTGKDIEKQPVNDFTMALQGRISGVLATQATGTPGSALKVSIRGINSLANGTDPLYIIDGVPFPSQSLSQFNNATGSGGARLSPLNSIRPENIESITVLKDADATAIYGSRGANGVILITTKKAIGGTTKASFNVYKGTNKIPRFIKLMNTEQYLTMRNEAFKNDNATPAARDYDINGTWSKDRYTDWQKELIGDSAETWEGRGSVSGGNENTQFLLSSGYRHETTIFPGDYKSKIGTVSLNVNHRSDNKRFFAVLSAAYANSKYDLPTSDISSFMYMAPNAPSIYDAKGNINWENNTFENPIASNLHSSTSTSDNLVSNLAMSYQILKGLSLKTMFGYNNAKIDESLIIPYTSRFPGRFTDASASRSYTRGNNALATWNVEPQLSYDLSFADHHFESLIGTTFQSTRQKSIRIDVNGYGSDALIENPAFATNKNVSAAYSDYRYTAVYARLGYN